MRRGDDMHTRSTDGAPLKITREIPLPWLVSAIVVVIGWGVSNYVGVRELANATKENTEELKRISAQMNAQMITAAAQDSRIQEHERRINSHESIIVDLQRRVK